MKSFVLERVSRRVLVETSCRASFVKLNWRYHLAVIQSLSHIIFECTPYFHLLLIRYYRRRRLYPRCLPNKYLKLMILFTNEALITNMVWQLSAARRCQFETLFEKPITKLNLAVLNRTSENGYSYRWISKANLNDSTKTVIRIAKIKNYILPRR